MTSYANYNRLIRELLIQIFAHLNGGLDAIHLRHVEIGEDNLVGGVHLCGFFECRKSFFA